jgi:hypothetical protein
MNYGDFNSGFKSEKQSIPAMEISFNFLFSLEIQDVSFKHLRSWKPIVNSQKSLREFRAGKFAEPSGEV